MPRGVIGRERLDKLLTWESKVKSTTLRWKTLYLEVHVVPVLILELLCGEVGPLEVRYGPPVYMVARDDVVGSVDVDDLMRCWVQL